MNDIKLTKAQEDTVQTREGIIRQYPGRGYMLTDVGRKLADKLGNDATCAKEST